MRRQEANEREACCPVCRRQLHVDVVVGMVVLGEEPAFYGQVRHRKRESDLRPWLDPTIPCRRGHRLKVPAGQALERLIERAPEGEPIYLPKADAPTPIKLRLEPVPRR